MTVLRDLKAGDRDLTITAKVVFVGKTESAKTKFGDRSVARAIVDDGSAQMEMPLWERNIERVQQGKTYVFEHVNVNEYKGQRNLQVHKDTKITVAENQTQLDGGIVDTITNVKMSPTDSLSVLRQEITNAMEYMDMALKSIKQLRGEK